MPCLRRTTPACPCLPLAALPITPGAALADTLPSSGAGPAVCGSSGPHRCRGAACTQPARLQRSRPSSIASATATAGGRSPWCRCARCRPACHAACRGPAADSRAGCRAAVQLVGAPLYNCTLFVSSMQCCLFLAPNCNEWQRHLYFRHTVGVVMCCPSSQHCLYLHSHNISCSEHTL